MTVDDEAAQLRYAQALSDWAEARGYEAETALGHVHHGRARHARTTRRSGARCAPCPAASRSAWSWRRCCAAPTRSCCSTSRTTTSTCPASAGWRSGCAETRKTVLFVSHDRELLARSAEKIVSVEPGPAGADAWVHGGGFATYHEARRERFARFEELRRRWDEKHAQLKKLVLNLRQAAAVSHEMASRYAAAQTRLRKFEEAGPPPEPPREQDITMRLHGGRTGVRAVTCKGLELTGLMKPFDLEVFYGERVAVLGSNGSGKSHFLRLLAGGDDGRAHRRVEAGRARGARPLRADPRPPRAGGPHPARHPVVRARPGPRRGHVPAAPLRADRPGRADVRAALGRPAGPVPDPAPGAGQGSTALLLDEPTDNLDLESAEALQEGLEAFDGTVLAVTHDRWFARSFDRYLVFGSDGRVRETREPVWDERRVERARG